MLPPNFTDYCGAVWWWSHEWRRNWIDWVKVVVGQTGDVLLPHEAVIMWSTTGCLLTALMGPFMQVVAAGTEKEIYSIPF